MQWNVNLRIKLCLLVGSYNSMQGNGSASLQEAAVSSELNWCHYISSQSSLYCLFLFVLFGSRYISTLNSHSSNFSFLQKKTFFFLWKRIFSPRRKIFHICCSDSVPYQSFFCLLLSLCSSKVSSRGMSVMYLLPCTVDGRLVHCGQCESLVQVRDVDRSTVAEHMKKHLGHWNANSQLPYYGYHLYCARPEV